MTPWNNMPGKQPSKLERALGADWKGYAFTAVILLSLGASMVLQAPNEPQESGRFVPPSPAIQAHNAWDEAPRARSSIEVAPRWGGDQFKPFEEQVETTKAETATAQTAPASSLPAAPDLTVPAAMPDVSGMVRAQAAKALQPKKEGGKAGGIAQSTQNSAASTKTDGGVQKVTENGKEYYVAEGYRSNTTHAHDGSGTHAHGVDGGAGDGSHKHKVRYKIPVEPGVIPEEMMQKLGLTKINLYKLEEIATQMHNQSLTTGAPMKISDEDARRIAIDIGLTRGKKEVAPSANPF